MRRISLALATAALALGVVACGGDDEPAASSSPDAPLVVGASPVPHAEILNFIKDNLAEKNGLELEV